MSLLDQIEGNLLVFNADKKKLYRLRDETAALRYAAHQAGEIQRWRELQDLQYDIADNIKEWYGAKEKINFVVNTVNKIPGVSWQPLGAPPVMIIGAVAVASTAALTAMAVVINKTIQMKLQLNAIKDGMDPEVVARVEATSGLGLGGIFGGIGVGSIAALAAVFFLMK